MIFSTNDVLGDSDDRVLAEFEHIGALEAGTSYARTENVTLPNDTDGAGHLFVLADASDLVSESNELNNVSTAVLVNVVRSYADLQVDSASFAQATAESGRPVDISWRIYNRGIAATAESTWADSLVLSADTVLGNADDVALGSIQHTGVLEVDGSYTATTTISLPEAIEGEYHVFVRADVNLDVFERLFEDNNQGRTILPLSVTRRPEADLQVTSIDGPSEGQPNEPVVVGYTVTNVSDGVNDEVADASWVDRIYLSPDASVENAVLLAEVRVTRMWQLVPVIRAMSPSHCRWSATVSTRYWSSRMQRWRFMKVDRMAMMATINPPPPKSRCDTLIWCRSSIHYQQRQRRAIRSVWSTRSPIRVRPRRKRIG